MEANLYAKEWLEAAQEGEVFELEEADLVRRGDGLYIAERR
jgi:predicted transcriptional regulator